MEVRGGGANAVVEVRNQSPVEERGWNNNGKKTRKRQQVYVQKDKNQRCEVDDQPVPLTQKDGDAEGHAKQKNTNRGMLGAMYITNSLNNNKGRTIRASSDNAFQCLAGLGDKDLRTEWGDGIRGNHSYLCSEDEEANEDANPGEEGQRGGAEIGETDKVEEKENVVAAISFPASKDVDAECIAAEHDAREQDVKGSGEEIDKLLPSCLVHDSEGDLPKDNVEGSDDGNEESGAEYEEEDLIKSYGKIPAECGMPPSLTMVNRKFQGDPDVPIEVKKQKKRNTPAPERPEGSRITRHSAAGKSGIRKGFLM